MSNQEIAGILRNIASAYIITGENRFKIVAYEKAADSIENFPVPVKDLWKEGKLNTIPAVGSNIAGHLNELFQKGKVKHFQSVLRKISPAFFPLLDVSGIGPKKAHKLVTTFKLKDKDTVIEDLIGLCEKGKIATLSDFGEKSQEDILLSLRKYKSNIGKEKRILLSQAYQTAYEVIDYLKQSLEVLEAQILGSLRRMVSTIGDIDIAVTSIEPQKVIEWYLKYPEIERVVVKGESKIEVILRNGLQVDLRIESPKRFGAMLQYFTGSKNHNIHLREYALKRGLSLSEYGIKQAAVNSKPASTAPASPNRGEKRGEQLTINKNFYNKKTKIYEFEKEKEFYEALDLSWIPPELREDTGEIEKAIKNELPKLVELSDIKGDLHIHSNYNLEPSHDLGRSSISDILREAQRLNYEYVGISDHNPSYSNHSQEEIVSILKRRNAYIEQISRSTKFTRVHLFTMLEIDILPDGQLPINNQAFEFLDAAIVSIHTSFAMNKEEMTKRILKGLSHPKAKILAHPTGRLLNKRDGFEVDWEELFSFCLKNDKAIEINSCSSRLDLPDILVKRAIEKGVKIVIDSDSHEKDSMVDMKFGVSQARRGWAQTGDILNALPYNTFRDWLLKN